MAAKAAAYQSADRPPRRPLIAVFTASHRQSAGTPFVRLAARRHEWGPRIVYDNHLMEPRIRYVHTVDGVSMASWTPGEGLPLVHPPVLVWHHAQLALNTDRPLAWARSILQESCQRTRRRKRCLGKM